ncbi:MAG: hypothetical protein V9E92_01805 [Methylotenera sp.]
MKIEISEDIKALATLCKHDFACLKSENYPLCKVQDCINGKVHFIECKDHDPCVYKTSFGYGHICNCPVRKEIYNKYKI